MDLADRLDIGELGDMAMEIALALAIRQLDADADGLSEDLLGLDRILGAEQVEIDLVEAAQLLRCRHMAEQQHILAERRRHLELTVGLSDVYRCHAGLALKFNLG